MTTSVTTAVPWGATVATTDAAGHALAALPAVPALAATATVVLALARPAHRTRLARPLALCALLSLALTAGHPLTGVSAPARAWWSLVEAVPLLLLIAAVTRWSPPRARRAAVPLACLAVAVWPAALIGGGPLERAGAVVFWLLPALVATAFGVHQRRLARRRADAVAAARRDQRLQLSRDLHDFVAHDISGIVVQAQAARFVAAHDPGQAALALERIEKAGLNALAAMDRTVAMLHDDGTTAQPLPGLDRLPALVVDFASPGGARARLRMPPDLAAALSREAGAAVYRVVVEALTNVRRHAPAATRVDVRLTRTATTVRLRVTNDRGRTALAPLPRRGTPGGLGVPALTEHVRALGGTLYAGPHGTGGWALTADFPTAVRVPAEPPRPSP
ncbi:two-component sensor histidine kinase [Streptomyces sp. SID4919]|uniref:sensor histidine kinase n=1 Tax=unclassified Streptomyces TaxID=2593676 RepID=UPI000823F6B3|nr:MULTISPECIES: histidine kinase [unclassified Streptomyces]MYY10498.1 two-component sensor histidine kinase [Streptomyces sp. SID4919]SCK46946.1 Histidine kinase [Streptomyces sp. AmelKG-E11A]